MVPKVKTGSPDHISALGHVFFPLQVVNHTWLIFKLNIKISKFEDFTSMHRFLSSMAGTGGTVGEDGYGSASSHENE